MADQPDILFRIAAVEKNLIAIQSELAELKDSQSGVLYNAVVATAFRLLLWLLVLAAGGAFAYFYYITDKSPTAATTSTYPNKTPNNSSKKVRRRQSNDDYDDDSHSPATPETRSPVSSITGKPRDINFDNSDSFSVVSMEQSAFANNTAFKRKIKERVTGIRFDSVYNDMELVGMGASIKKRLALYAVALYGPQEVFDSAAKSPEELRKAVHENSTIIVCTMYRKVTTRRVARALAAAMGPRYGKRNLHAVEELQDLIASGLEEKKNVAVKGTKFEFFLSDQGIVVVVGGMYQGVAAGPGLREAFLDIYFDDKTVSPSLRDSCLSVGRRNLSSIKESSSFHSKSSEEELSQGEPQAPQKPIFTPKGPMIEKSTGFEFDPKLDDLDLVGVGVSWKGPIKVFGTGLYASKEFREAMAELSGSSEEKRKTEMLKIAHEHRTTILLDQSFPAAATRIATGLADVIAPRFNGSSSALDEFKDLICKGLAHKNGTATKRTKHQFDFVEEGVYVTIDGAPQGLVENSDFGKAFREVCLELMTPTLCADVCNNCCNV